jgi:endonuclease YncB( thermonuclease family)
MFRHVAIGLVICSLSGSATAHPGGVDEDGCHKESRTGERHCHPERAKHAKRKPAYDSEHPPKPGEEGVFYGPLIGIVDGDTFKAKVQGVVMKCRLEGVDAPEHDQPYGAISTNVLREIIGGRDLVLVFSDVDHYGRIVAQAWVGNLDVNAEMVRRGAAWSESEYAPDERLYLLEQEARDRKVGLWVLPLKDRVPPSAWRGEKR